MSAFPRFIRLAEQGKNLLFCDEAIFTSKQINLKVWYTKGFNQKIKKKKLHFGAIAVVAATDLHGKVVAALQRDKSIDAESFQEFLRLVARRMRRRKCYMMVDNLGVHRTQDVKKQAKRSNVELIFNGTYSSEYNPIERLWAWSKRHFSYLCIDEG